ncbi:MAG: chemotaxis response regulator protein-glutamate methylesterase [Rickettsiales bacterium]|nr:chemotaxis response regulator protein-glutamate methylesterase [Rickettsiales bacterium]
MEQPVAASSSPEDKITVMLVDDSSIVRSMLSRILRGHPNIKVVATANDGRQALDVVEQHDVDIIILDIEMPNMTGIEALPELLKRSPSSKIIMASTLTTRNASISLEAIKKGAADYLAKPHAQDSGEAREIFFKDLETKIMALGAPALKRKANKHVAVEETKAPVSQYSTQLEIPKTDYPQHPIKAIAIASSTGGPQALSVVLKDIAAYVKNVPIFITQHMPAAFTKLLSEHLSKDSGLECVEAENDIVVRPGKVYIAPGDYHMIPKQDGITVMTTINQDPPVNFCRPAADPMIEALIEIYGKNMLLLVLTGMGSDGAKGAEQLVAKGGTVVAQDEKSSVVWGMPRAVVKAKACQAVLPLNELGAYVERGLRG